MKTVLVSNLSPVATEDDLAKLLELVGAVRVVRLARRPDGSSGCCAVVEFELDNHAKIAREVFDGREHLGHILSLRAYARPSAG